MIFTAHIHYKLKYTTLTLSDYVHACVCGVPVLSVEQSLLFHVVQQRVFPPLKGHINYYRHRNNELLEPLLHKKRAKQQIIGERKNYTVGLYIYMYIVVRLEMAIIC